MLQINMVLENNFFVRQSVDEYMCMCQLLRLSESVSRVGEALKVFLQRGINGLQQGVNEQNYTKWRV